MEKTVFDIVEEVNRGDENTTQEHSHILPYERLLDWRSRLCEGKEC